MSYSDVEGHYHMVMDQVRNSAYARALKALVNPSSRVMDLGAGLGVLGLLAAKLGAEQVVLVEPAAVAEVGRKLARANGFENVDTHNCSGEALNIEQKFDILLSVFTGNMLLEEDLLPDLFLARERFLAPGGTLLPDRGTLNVLPVSMADYYQTYVMRWNEYASNCRTQGLPVIALDAVRPYINNTMFYDSAKNFGAKKLASSTTMLDLDFYTATEASCDSEQQVVILHSGWCHGWIGWFDIKLGAEWLSTSLDAPATHWSQVFMPLPNPIEVSAGEIIKFRLQRPQYGDWTWTTTHRGKPMRGSSFLRKPVKLEDLKKASDAYRPQLSRRGEAAAWLLENMTGADSQGVLRDALMSKFPDEFAAPEQASEFVKSLAWSYA